MPGISNRSKSQEDAGQARVEARKDELPDFEAANRPRKDHPIDKDRKQPPVRRGQSASGKGGDRKGR